VEQGVRVLVDPRPRKVGTVLPITNFNERLDAESAVRCREHSSWVLLVVLFQMVDDVVATVHRIAVVDVDEVRDLVVSTGHQLVVCEFIGHVATLVSGKPRVVDDVRDAELGELLADLPGVRTAF
jgi:hypothetical protein